MDSKTLIILVLFSSILMACGDRPGDDNTGDDKTGDDNTGDDSGAGADDTSAPDECYERVGDPMYDPLDIKDCNLTFPCATVKFNLSDEYCSNHSYDPEAAQCALDVLAAGEVGELLFKDCPGGQYSSDWKIQSLGDGTIIWIHNISDDHILSSRGSWRALPDASYFAACSASTPESLMSCIQALELEECQLGIPTCP